jgi:hypothetical protein
MKNEGGGGLRLFLFLQFSAFEPWTTGDVQSD